MAGGEQRGSGTGVLRVVCHQQADTVGTEQAGHADHEEQSDNDGRQAVADKTGQTQQQCPSEADRAAQADHPDGSRAFDQATVQIIGDENADGVGCKEQAIAGR